MLKYSNDKLCRVVIMIQNIVINNNILSIISLIKQLFRNEQYVFIWNSKKE